MKKSLILKTILFFTAMFTVTTAVAFNNDVEIDPSFNALISVFLPAILAELAVLFADASKHWGTPKWDWSKFFKTKVKPFSITLGLAIVLYFLIAYVPFLKPILEKLVDFKLVEMTSAGFFGLATALIDGFGKKFRD